MTQEPLKSESSDPQPEAKEEQRAASALNERALANPVERIVNSLIQKIPTGPQEVTAGNRLTAAARGPWAVDQDADSNLTIAVPPNWESWGDDYQSIAAAAAINLLKPHCTLFSNEDWDITLQLKGDELKSSAQYFAGIAHGLRYLSSRPYEEFSGSFGKGYSWVAHQWLNAQDLPPWTLKGSERRPTTVWTRSAWAKQLPASLLRLEALLRRAARSIDMSRTFASWIRSSSEMSGRGIRKSRPWKDTKILTAEEKDWFDQTYSLSVLNMENFYVQIDDKDALTIEFVKSIPAKCRQLAGTYRSIEEKLDDVTRLRMTALTKGRSRRQLAADRKKPITLRIAELDMLDRMAVFHPGAILGKIFRIPPALLDAVNNNDPEAIAEISEHIHRFSQSISNERLSSMTDAWLYSVTSE